MRAMLLALLLGAVLQSQGQKFPKVVGQLPKLHKELPGPGVCPKLPECFFLQEKIDITFPSYQKALVWFMLHEYCQKTIWITNHECRGRCLEVPVRIQGNSIAEAINSLVKQHPLYWVLLPQHYGYLMAGRTRQWSGLQ